MAEEKRFENKVKHYLESKGIYGAGTPKQKRILPVEGWYTKIWGGGFQKAGIPDLICCINGKFVAVELKASNGKPSFLQELNLSLIEQGNGIGILLYPKDFENFKTCIESLINGNNY